MDKIIEIRAPESLGGESITEGIVKIKKSIGQFVKVDDLVFEIETDKIALELTAEVSGRIIEFLVKEDDVISPGQLLARLSVGEIEEIEKAEEIEKEKVKKIIIEDASRRSSPSARKIIEENLISTENIKGTGIKGRITKADVINHINYESNKMKSSENKEKRREERREERIKMSKIRKVIAARLKESQNTAAILTTFNEIDMKNVIDLRVKYKEMFEKKYGLKLSFMLFFIKAVIQALKEIPEINAEILDNEEIIYKYYYDIGIAVGADKGLVVPVIRNADQMSLAEIELTLSTLNRKAKEGKLQVSEMKGATFTISNGGIYGSLFSTPIINPPQSGILGMHSIQNRPVVIGNSIEIRPMMYIALSYDHRIVDGREAVTFLFKIKSYIEDPARLVLEV